MNEYSYENAETRYKIETVNEYELELYLNSRKMISTLYDLLNWKSNIYNGKIYDEGKVLYRGELYERHDWDLMKHTDDEYDEKTHCLKDKVEYVYTEEDLLRCLDKYLDEISDFVYKYM